ncbi:MAG: hypothetical protein DWQ04_02920 [Chloroflexi bacterium]|nr:MAG: hypothetical protein DWQ04_02920 [Chloroflexota bacterium]
MTQVRKPTLILGFIWMVMMLFAIAQYPSVTHLWLAWASVFYIVYYIGLSIYMMRQPKQPD